MGELADAIRDHLELKRRRGADPAEVAKQEQEALTPVTRSHPIVAVPPRREAELQLVHGGEATRGLAREPEGNGDELDDATQEFHVEQDWLADAGG